MRVTQAGAAGVVGIALSHGCAPLPPPLPVVPEEAAESLAVEPPASAVEAAAVPASAGDGAVNDGPVDGEVALEYTLGPGTQADCMAEARFRALSGLNRTEIFAPPGAKARYVARIAVERAPDKRSFRAVVTMAAGGGENGEADPAASQSIVEGYPCTNVLGQVVAGLHMTVRPRPAPAPAKAACPEARACPPPPRPRTLTTRELLAQVCEQLKDVYGPCMDWHAAVMAGGLFAAGYPVDVAGGFYGGAELRFGEYHKEVLSLGLELRGLLPALAYTYADGARVEASTITGALVPCGRWRMLAGCLPLEVGAIIYGGSPATYREDVGPLVTLGPRVGLDLLVTDHFALRGFADVRFPLLRPGYIDDGLGERVWRWPIASVLFGLGVGFE